MLAVKLLQVFPELFQDLPACVLKTDHADFVPAPAPEGLVVLYVSEL